MAATKKTGAAKRVVLEPQVRRRVVEDDEEDGDMSPALSYFADLEGKDVEFISSGCALLDCVLAGGWVLGRVTNIVGDRSAGKTLLAIEACANFHQQYPDGLSRYAESEAAFDEGYAEALGMPLDRVDMGKAGTFGREVDEPMETVEDWFRSVEAFVDRCQKAKVPGLYIIDSFDALSDEAEMERDIEKGSFGANKAKKSGELFRKLVRRMEAARVGMIVVSQIRDKLNVTFGETKTRSGGRALDFYATHIVWLAEIGKIKKTIGGIERPVGVDVRAKVKKNKVGLPFRECDYPIMFGYGVDDMMACAEWITKTLKKPELLKEADMSANGYKVRISNLRDKGGEEARETRKLLAAIVKREWQRVEQSFVPKSRKY